jgi:hypothetical protein
MKTASYLRRLQKKPLGAGVKLRDIAELRITLFQQGVEGESAKTAEVVPELFADHFHRCGGVVLRPAYGFAQDIIDAAK